MDKVINTKILAGLPQQPNLSAAERDGLLPFEHASAGYSDLYSAHRRLATPSLEFLSSAIATIDVLIILLIASSTFLLYFWLSGRASLQPSFYVGTGLIGAIVFVSVFERARGYSLKRLQELKWQVSRITLSWLVAASILLLMGFVGRISAEYSRGWALLWFFTSTIALIATRSVEHTVLTRRMRNGSLARNVVIVGAGEEGQRLVAKLRQRHDLSFRVRGIFDDRRSRRPFQIHDIRVLGTTDDLLNLARQERIDEVVVALPLSAEARLKEIFEKLTIIPCDLRLSINGIGERFPITGVDYLAESPMLEIIDRPLKQGRGLCKWVEDKLLAALILTVVGPLLILIAVLIKLDSPGPVFFVQPRFGFNNNVIRVLKFRTMYQDRCDHSGALRTLQDDPRVTRIGRILRPLSLDELPQLINVFKGDMSIVGPRPHAVAMKAGDRLYHEAVEKYPHRHRVKPGITGWAQVNGFRGEVDTLEKARGRLDHDLYYIANWSVLLDLKILFMTVRLLISRTDAY